MADTKDVKDESNVESRSLDDNLTAPVLDHSAVDPVYQAKAHVLNNAVQQIGMGRYQWELVSLTLSSCETAPLNHVCRIGGYR